MKKFRTMKEYNDFELAKDKIQIKKSLQEYFDKYHKYKDELLNAEDDFANIDETDDEEENEYSIDIHQRDIDNAKYELNETKVDLMHFILDRNLNYELFKETSFYKENMFVLLIEMNEQYAPNQDAFY